MTFSTNDIVAELTDGGAVIKDYILIDNQIYLVNQRGELMLFLVDDADGDADGGMHDAIVKYLREIGSPIYQCEEEFYRQREGLGSSRKSEGE